MDHRQSRVNATCANLVGCLAVLLCSMTSCGGQRATAQARAQSPACTYGDWSPPATRDSVGPVLLTARSPALAFGDQGVIVGVAGSEAINPGVAEAGERGVWPPELRVLPFDGPAVPSLSETPRQFWFSYPRVAVDTAGTVHVIWGEPDVPPPASPAEMLDGEVEITGLWYAKYAGGAWTQPEQVYHARAIRWQPENVSALKSTAAGELHLAFTAVDSLGPHVTHLYRDSGISRRWTPRVWRPGAPPVYADVAVDSGGYVAVTYVASVVDGTTRQHNGLFVSLSHDRGVTWTEPSLLTNASQVSAYEPRVMIDRPGNLHIVWRQGRANEIGDGVAWHIASSDRGRTWSAPAAVTLPLTSTRLEAVADQCGGIHVVTEAHSRDLVQLSYVRFADGGWTMPRLLFGGVAAEQPSIAVDPTGRVHLVWNVMPARPRGGGQYQSGVEHSSLRVVQSTELLKAASGARQISGR